ncbi:glycosyltransferase [Nitratiruptor sp. YY09-18]|uniref:glycosyltransferase n=1 Tax=Nitratiruptor sp. YY09-18 TaxID=2724901 RepID=UPI001914DC50|nr:glycosyltransferase [Nitratiruptor sp. YY09-18]BCD67623.1 poly(glycerol-phosphate) alpha-glucosyltransferase [Nitratiruptor sp. YY09-18]
MKILQFIASSKYVGAERSFVELCNELAKQEEIVALVVRGCEYKERFFPKVEVIELHSNPSRYNPFLYLEIAKIIKKLQPDIVHAHSAKATQILYRLWRFMKFAFVATKRNTRKDKIFHKVPYPVTVSKQAAKIVDNPNTTVIYDGIIPHEVACNKEDIFTILAIGALRPVKCFDDLIESVRDLDFPFKLWIVGEGEEREKLENLIQKYDLQGKVELLGYREDTPCLQKRAHLQIINSEREGFARVLKEGLFYSDVVISTPVSGSVEILSKKLLFAHGEAAQKIQDIYNNYEEYKKEFAKIKEMYAKDFLLQKSAQKYLNLYKRVLSKKG